jgi:hypothetical protein
LKLFFIPLWWQNFLSKLVEWFVTIPDLQFVKGMCTQVGLQHERPDIEDHGLTDKSSTLWLTTPPLQKTPNLRALDSLWSQSVLGVLRLNTWIQHKQHFCSFLITRTEFIKLWKMLNPENNADKKALDFWMKNLPLSWSWLTARSTRPHIGERIYYREVEES